MSEVTPTPAPAPVKTDAQVSTERALAFQARVQQTVPGYRVPTVSTVLSVPAARSQVAQTTTHGEGTPAQRAEIQRQIFAASQQTGEPSTRAGVSTHADRLTFAHAVEPRIDPDGYIDSHLLHVNGVLSWGYALPPGVKVHAATAYSMLEIARAIDLPQEYVTKWFNATEGKPK
jgi:hypothetical protein